jgi:hypothetical protein
VTDTVTAERRAEIAARLRGNALVQVGHLIDLFEVARARRPVVVRLGPLAYDLVRLALRTDRFYGGTMSYAHEGVPLVRDPDAPSDWAACAEGESRTTANGDGTETVMAVRMRVELHPAKS